MHSEHTNVPVSRWRFDVRRMLPLKGTLVIRIWEVVMDDTSELSCREWGSCGAPYELQSVTLEIMK